MSLDHATIHRYQGDIALQGDDIIPPEINDPFFDVDDALVAFLQESLCRRVHACATATLAGVLLGALTWSECASVDTPIRIATTVSAAAATMACIFACATKTWRSND